MSVLEFLSQDAVTVAQELLGWRLYSHAADGTVTGGRIIETEAYNQDDAASHSYRGKTPRTEVMFGPSGRVYIYFTYGMHWCMNIVVGPSGRGEAVFIRAIELDQGRELARSRRGHRPDSQLTNGPAKICEALGITGADNGAVIGGQRFELLPPDQPLGAIHRTERIGISQDTHRLWRFVMQ